MTKERDNQKDARQKMIIELVQNEAIQTQMELIERLHSAGFAGTQATVSRDIRELQIGKSVNAEGIIQYVLPKNNNSKRKFEMFFVETVLSVDMAGHILLVKCLAGMANAACELFDRECDAAQWDGVVGTLAGDNTFMILMRNEEEAAVLCARLQHYIQAHSHNG